MSNSDTKDKILVAAERLFAERGVAATSLRAVTQKAGVNLAAVHYHFGSKNALLQAVLARTLGPINQERLKHLERLEFAAQGEILEIEPLLEAFLRPAVFLADELGESRPLLSRLLSRLYSDEGEGFHVIVIEQFAEVIERFGWAFVAALPELPPEEVFGRFHYVAAVLMHSLSDVPDVSRFLPVPRTPSDPEAVLRRMVSFLSAGLRAPEIPTLQGAP